MFEGGFLGLDNIGVFDRSAPLPTGGHLEQADGTAWMALFSQNMLELAVELATHDLDLRGNGLQVRRALLLHRGGINRSGSTGMWDDEDGFYYDLLSAARRQRHAAQGAIDGRAPPAMRYHGDQSRRNASAFRRPSRAILERLRRMPELCGDDAPCRTESLRRWPDERGTGPGEPGAASPDSDEDARRERVPESATASARYPGSTRTILYVFRAGGQEHRVDYLPAESDSGMFGGNSNWRGPIWMPVNVMLIRAPLNFYAYHGDTFKILSARPGPER